MMIKELVLKKISLLPLQIKSLILSRTTEYTTLSAHRIWTPTENDFKKIESVDYKKLDSLIMKVMVKQNIHFL